MKTLFEIRDNREMGIFWRGFAVGTVFMLVVIKVFIYIIGVWAR